jgi:hypothetical protein
MNFNEEQGKYLTTFASAFSKNGRKTKKESGQFCAGRSKKTVFAIALLQGLQTAK